MHPGTSPFDELAAALVRLAADPAPPVTDHLDGEDGLLVAAEAVLADNDAELLIVVDQFEEVFTLVSDEVRANFLTALSPCGPTSTTGRCPTGDSASF